MWRSVKSVCSCVFIFVHSRTQVDGVTSERLHICILTVSGFVASEGEMLLDCTEVSVGGAFAWVLLAFEKSTNERCKCFKRFSASSHCCERSHSQTQIRQLQIKNNAALIRIRRWNVSTYLTGSHRMVHWRVNKKKHTICHALNYIQNTHTHTHIYIYMCVCVCVCVCVKALSETFLIVDNGIGKSNWNLGQRCLQYIYIHTCTHTHIYIYIYIYRMPLLKCFNIDVV